MRYDSHIGGEKNMTKIYTTENIMRARSPNRPKSLHLLIPATVRDIMGFTKDDQIIMDVLDEQGSKILKIYKKPE